MKVHYGFDTLPHLRCPAATVGSFDGVHGGHRLLLDRVREEARNRDGESVVLTFDPHPRITLGCDEGLRLLTSTEEKAWLLEQAGIDHLILIPFDRAFSRLSPEEFVRDYLIGKVGIQTLVVGYNHRFGCGNEGDYALLERLHDECGFRVVRIAEYDVASEKVSSTVLRDLIARGEMERAARLMSHPYLLIGRECVDEGIVRMDEPRKLLPPAGLYAVEADGAEARLMIGPDGVLRLLRDKNVEMPLLRAKSACISKETCAVEPEKRVNITFKHKL